MGFFYWVFTVVIFHCNVVKGVFIIPEILRRIEI